MSFAGCQSSNYFHEQRVREKWESTDLQSHHQHCRPFSFKSDKDTFGSYALIGASIKQQLLRQHHVDARVPTKR